MTNSKNSQFSAVGKIILTTSKYIEIATGLPGEILSVEVSDNPVYVALSSKS